MLTRCQHLALAAPLIMVVVPFLICPALLGFLATFTSYSPFRPDFRFVLFDNYIRLWNDTLFRAAVGNGLLLTAITVPLQLVLGLALALVLRRPFRGRPAVRALLLLPWLVSPAASGVLWHYLLSDGAGIAHYLTGLFGLLPPPPMFGRATAFPVVILVEIWRKVPLVMFLVLPGVLAISPDQWDNARLDGLKGLGRLRHVVLARTRTLLLTILLLLLGDAFGTAESILFLTGGGPGTVTLMPGLYSYNRALGAQNWALGATAGWLIGLAALVSGIGYLVFMRRQRDA